MKLGQLYILSLIAGYHALALPFAQGDSPNQSIQVSVVQTQDSSTGGPFPSSSSSQSSSSSSSSSSSQLPMILGTLIPLVVIFTGLSLLPCYYRLRKRRQQRAGAHGRSQTTRNRASSDARPLTSASTRSLTAEQLAGTNRTGGRSVNRAGNGSNTASSSPGSRRNRRERGLRRTESGRSVRTLPAYSKEAGDEEIVLVRQRSEEEYEDDENNEIRFRQQSSLEPTPEIDITGPTDCPEEDDGVEVHALDSINRRGWGEAPEYLESTHTPPVTASSNAPLNPQGNAGLEAGSSETMLEGLQRARSSFFSLFRAPIQGNVGQRNRSGSANSTSSFLPLIRQNRSASISSNLSLMPYPSRMSTVSGITPQTSTPSLVISSPLPHTAVRVSFDARDLPRGGLGLSDDQMRFLGSSEAVNLIGVQIGEPPVGGRGRRRSDVPSEAGDDSHGHGRRSSDGRGRLGAQMPLEPPPSWDEINRPNSRMGTILPVTQATIPSPSVHATATTVPLPISPTSPEQSSRSDPFLNIANTQTPVQSVSLLTTSVAAH